jgi:hypothetical protein
MTRDMDIITTTRLLLECILRFNSHNSSIINQEYIEPPQQQSLLVVIHTDHTAITTKITAIIRKIMGIITAITTKITAIIRKITGIITGITAKITAIMGKIMGFLALFSAKITDIMGKITAIIAEITAIIPIKDSIKAQEKQVLTAIIAA